MMLVVVVPFEMRCPISGCGMNVKAPLLRLSFSQACQSTLHLKFDVKICSGQFLVTKVTDGQHIEQPKRKIWRLAILDLRDFLIRMGVSKMRLILRLALVWTFCCLRIS